MILDPRRERMIVAAVAVWVALVAYRLVQVQAFQHTAWEAEAARQRERSVEVEEPRGDIRSRDGRLLAGSVERVALYVNPRQIAPESWPSLAAELAALSGHSTQEILSLMEERDGFTYIDKDLDPAVVDAVARLRQRGVGTLRTERRAYPHAALAGPTIGFVNSEGRGQAGLEAFYEHTLRGVPSLYRVLRDGKLSPTQLDLRMARPGRPGQSLVLSIDLRMQQLVEEELRATLTKVGGRGAAGVVMDVRTGELLAVASLPSYDPGHITSSPTEARHNHAVEDSLEPGSTFKPFIVAGALAAGLLAPTDLVDCSGGGVLVAGFFIRDHARYGMLPLRELLAQSSNAGAIRIAQMLQPGQLDTVIRAFGFGQPTGVELGAEARGIYRSPEHWSRLSRASLALGQEITVTPMQLAQGYAALGNGGLLVRPTLVLETRDRDGRLLTPARPQSPRRVIPQEVSYQLSRLLEGVVETGTGKAASVPGFRVAGKTGTAQRPVRGSYSAGRHVAWFAGLLPMPDPRVVIVVCVDEPEATFWASDVAAPAFGRIAQHLVNLLSISPPPGERL